MKTDQQSQREMLDGIDTTFTSLETLRTEELVSARQLLEIDEAALEREQERLSQKYTKDHPRVQKIMARRDYNQLLAKGLDSEIERSTLRMPPFPANAWRVHGRVFDKSGKALANQSVYLADENRQPVTSVAYARTDQQGYYALTVDEKEVDNLQNRKLHITVATSKRNVLYTAAEAIPVSKGVIELRNIYLGADNYEPPYKPDEKGYEVWGTITRESGEPWVGLIIRAVNQGLTAENPLGKEATTDDKGIYHIPYQASDFIIDGKKTTGADIIIYVYTQSDKTERQPIHKSKIFRNSPRVTKIDLRIDGQKHE